jgi:hypothetical protein
VGKREKDTRRKRCKNIYLFIYLFRVGELNDGSMKPTTFLCLEPKLKMRGAVCSFAHAISYCDFLFSCLFTDILSFSGHAEPKSNLIAKQRV